MISRCDLETMLFSEFLFHAAALAFIWSAVIISLG